MTVPSEPMLPLRLALKMVFEISAVAMPLERLMFWMPLGPLLEPAELLLTVLFINRSIALPGAAPRVKMPYPVVLLTVLLVIVRITLPSMASLKIPVPALLLTVLFISVTDELLPAVVQKFSIPPAPQVAELFFTVLLIRVKAAPNSLLMPPPPQSDTL